jgi:lipopolysaccharide transport system ATP-binding protein
MENDFSIKVENVSKKYCKSLKRSMLYGVKDIARNSLGLSSNSHILRKDEFWAVKDISFEVKKGETLGIIGPNGAGKTTLLKLLNGIFWPDKGKITIKGKVGALIAVGAGFHPMLTGRENIFLNGAILGMSRHEVNRKFDTIVEFADIGDFLDTPVKFYSSGMFVRLGFSIASHSDADILLIDEILALGDLSFRAKCRKLIKDLSRKGVTIILITHNMHMLSYVCDNSLLLNEGKIIYTGNTDAAIDVYNSVFEQKTKERNVGTGEIRIAGFKLFNSQNKSITEIKTGDYIKIRIKYNAIKRITNPVFNIAIFKSNGEQITGIRNDVDGSEFRILQGEGYIDIAIENFNLLPNIYYFNLVILHSDGFTVYDFFKRIAKIKVLGGRRVNGDVFLPHSWVERFEE